MLRVGLIMSAVRQVDQSGSRDRPIVISSFNGLGFRRIVSGTALPGLESSSGGGAAMNERPGAKRFARLQNPASCFEPREVKPSKTFRRNPRGRSLAWGNV